VRNRAHRKEMHRETTEEFHTRFEAPRLLSGTVVTRLNKEIHIIKKTRK
jgi:hypothetical protein